MVEGEGALEAVSGDVPRVPVPADVVDQHINPGKGLEHLGSKPSHLHLGGKVGDENVHPPTAGGPDLLRRAFGALAVAPGDRKVRTPRGQAQGDGLADAAASGR